MPQPWQFAHETRPQARRRMTSPVEELLGDINDWRSWISPADFDLPLPRFVTRARKRRDKKWFPQIQWVPRLRSDKDICACLLRVQFVCKTAAACGQKLARSSYKFWMGGWRVLSWTIRRLQHRRASGQHGNGAPQNRELSLRSRRWLVVADRL